MATLHNLFTILKGSSSSGNFGHQGRPGKRGGSQSGGGHIRIGVDTSKNIREQIDAYRANRGKKGADTDFHNKEWLMKNILHDKPAEKLGSYLGIDKEAAKVLVGKAFSYKDEETGYTTSIDTFEISKLSNKSDRVRVGGKIYDSEGNMIGNFIRMIAPDGTIHHLIFQLDKQGSGFGSRFYENSEKAYKESGIKAVHLGANLQVGGYAWGRMGFDFEDKYEAVLMTDKIKDAFWDRYKKPMKDVPQTAYEMASFVGPDGHRLGKEVMLGSYWAAYKSLDDSDTGYQVGQAYYKNKKGKK